MSLDEKSTVNVKEVRKKNMPEADRKRSLIKRYSTEPPKPLQSWEMYARDHKLKIGKESAVAWKNLDEKTKKMYNMKALSMYMRFHHLMKKFERIKELKLAAEQVC